MASKIEYLYSNQRLGHIATLANGAVLVFVQRHMVATSLLLAWLGALVLVTFVRMGLLWHYNRQSDRHQKSNLWAKWFLTGIFISGLLWGVAGILFFPEASGAHQMFTAFIIGGMVAGAAAAFSAIRAAFFAFSLPALIPVIIHSFTYQDSIHIGMGIMLLLFFVLMCATSFRSYVVTDTSMKLEFRNKDLVVFLSKEKQRAERYNAELHEEIRERKLAEANLEAHQKELESVVAQRTAQVRASNNEMQLEMAERVRTESALKESEERYRLLVETANVGIVLIQGQDVKFVNTYISTITGYPQEEIIGQPFIQFVHPDDRELAMSNHVKRLKSEPVPEVYPIRIVDKHGQAHWLDVSAILMSYNKEPAILVFFRDITEQRNLEAQLFQAEKMASIGQLAAGVAHEINNPMGFVKSNLSTFKEYQEDLQSLIPMYQEVVAACKHATQEAAPDARMEKKIEAIESFEEKMDIEYVLEDWGDLIAESLEGTNRIKNIVLDLKNFAHPGRQELQMADINANLQSTLNIVWNELKYNADVVKDFGELPQIKCHPQQLNQVFMNLLVNAAQAIDGRGEIKITTRPSDNGSIKIKISDTGNGIPKEHLTKIFDPFFTTKPVGKGTGLGLNVSYNIIQKHNGTLAVDSALGKGTTFTIHLPVTF